METPLHPVLVYSQQINCAQVANATGVYLMRPIQVRKTFQSHPFLPFLTSLVPIKEVLPPPPPPPPTRFVETPARDLPARPLREILRGWRSLSVLCTPCMTSHPRPQSARSRWPSETGQLRTIPQASLLLIIIGSSTSSNIFDRPLVSFSI